MNVQELAQAFEKALARTLAANATTPAEAVALRPDRWVDAAVGALRDLGREHGLEVYPIRRGVADLGWEIAWGRNLLVDYAGLSRTNPAELFALDLVAEVSEGSLRSDSIPERAVEEVANDLAKLVWARAPLKVLFFGARREAEPANALPALHAGLGGVIDARDRDSDYLLVALPNLEASRFVAPEKATLVLQTVSRGKASPARETALAKLLEGAS